MYSPACLLKWRNISPPLFTAQSRQDKSHFQKPDPTFAVCQQRKNMISAWDLRAPQCCSVCPVTLCFGSSWANVSWRSTSIFKRSFMFWPHYLCSSSFENHFLLRCQRLSDDDTKNGLVTFSLILNIKKKSISGKERIAKGHANRFYMWALVWLQYWVETE